MTKGLVYLEKILAIIQIVTAAFLMFGLYQLIKGDLGFMTQEYNDIMNVQTTYQFQWKFVEYHQSYFFILLCFSGGVLSLFNQTVGWLLSIVVWICAIIYMLLLPFWTGYHGDSLIAFSVVILTIVIICVLFIRFLTLKEVLDKYKITTKHWLIVGCITVLLSLDLAWRHLF